MKTNNSIKEFPIVGDIGIGKTSPAAQVHIVCQCGVEMTMRSKAEFRINQNINCPQCGDNHIAFQANRSV